MSQQYRKPGSSGNQFRYSLKGGYFTDPSKKQIRREIIVEDAEAIAKKLASDKYTPMTATTLRRFYNMLRIAYDEYRSKNDFDAIVNKIQALEPEAFNSVKRGVAPRLFVDFIKENVRYASQNGDNLRAFVRHYQSVICYFPETKNR